MTARAIPALAAAIAGLLVLGVAVALQLVVELAAAPSVDGHHDVLAFWAAGRSSSTDGQTPSTTRPP